MADPTQLLDRPSPAAPAAPVLEVTGLTKRFPVGGLFQDAQVHALEDVSFRIDRGEVVAVVGESGSGKSTTARLVARLMPPTTGTIRLDGRDVLAAEPRRPSLSYRSKVQMVFQDPFGSLNPVHSIGHHIARPLAIHGKAKGKGETRDKTHELLATVGLNPPADYARKHPHELSGGQRQRVAIARALAPEPGVLVADEPVSMLDVSIRLGVLNLLAGLQRERDLGVLYITHDLATARHFSDDVLVMYRGAIVERGPADEVILNPQHEYTKRLAAAAPDPEKRLQQLDRA